MYIGHLQRSYNAGKAAEWGTGAAGCQSGLLEGPGVAFKTGSYTLIFLEGAHVSCFVNYLAFVFVARGQRCLFPVTFKVFYNVQNTFTSINVMFEF